MASYMLRNMNTCLATAHAHKYDNTGSPVTPKALSTLSPKTARTVAVFCDCRHFRWLYDGKWTHAPEEDPEDRDWTGLTP